MSVWDTESFILSLLAILSVIALYSHRRNNGFQSGQIPTVSTWFPLLGLDNGWRLYNNPTLFMEQMRQRYGPLYRFRVLGTSAIVIHHPYSLSQLERQTKELSPHLPFEGAAQAGSGKANVHRIVEILMNELVPITGREFSRQRMKDSGLKSRFHEELEKEFDQFSNPSGTTVLLSEFLRQTLYRATGIVIFGPEFPAESYDDIKATVPDISFLASRLSHLPWSKTGRARDRLLNFVIEYIRPWWEADGHSTKELSGVMVEGLVTMKEAGLSLPDAAAVLLPLLWGIHSNIWFHLYWMLAQIILDEDLLIRAQNEARSGKDITEMRLIESVMWEALRWPYSMQQLRRASEDLDVSFKGTRYFIPKDTWIISKLINHDSSIYEDPFEFKADRFLVNPSLPKPKTFGDGAHLCKGKQFALHQMPDFVVTVLRRFDVELVQRSGKDRKVPQSESNSFLPDISKFEEFTIKITPRASN
ncbi:hypothetical protein CC1G_10429 [Coprinopsis cinerea okayama7|uniref:Cytochrome P450 n=1 Tax=Coprinopsis cinerea (strain Okayama-7 / 130 / ATCC MYA-4618 / FGSC 9003) TaxID=240176 RepID=A8PDQ7_COPC7|nr:hypothetical protein CC1G_10429 [Coprinopsis cinerea okayama7\|eukprot:XP_001840643.1 hypothetical protein CC1G_10429 [Coprinopsis cinerea okayama7\